jgi:energy-coupling factor transport system substrate-specific component
MGTTGGNAGQSVGSTTGGGAGRGVEGAAKAKAGRKLNTRDLIIAGAFAAVYLVVFLAAVTASGFVPVLYLMVPLTASIILGPIFAVYCTKVNKPGAILILAVLVGLVESMGGVWICLVWAVAVGVLVELIVRAGRYRSRRLYLMGYCVFSMIHMGPFWLFIFAKSTFLDTCMQYYGAGYTATIDALTPPWIVAVLIALALIGGLIGALVGQRLLRKHFERAGVV